MPAATRRYLVVALAVGYAAFVALVGYWPTPVDRPLHSTLTVLIARLHSWGMPAFVSYGFVEFTANIAFFIPVGLLIALLLARKHWWIALGVSVALSVAIELGQLVFLPQRYPSLADVLSNSLGAAIGVVITLIARKVEP